MNNQTDEQPNYEQPNIWTTKLMNNQTNEQPN